MSRKWSRWGFMEVYARGSHSQVLKSQGSTPITPLDVLSDLSDVPAAVHQLENKDEDRPPVDAYIRMQQIWDVQFGGAAEIQKRAAQWSALGPSSFVQSAGQLGEIKSGDGIREVALIGRSNVGKSSLVNAMAGKTAHVAHVSRTPGRTQTLNLYGVGGVDSLVRMVDLPGYGYAAAPKPLVRAWQDRSATFLRTRSSLRKVYLLVDARHGIQSADARMLGNLKDWKRPFSLVFTKIDACSPSEVLFRWLEASAPLERWENYQPRLILTSTSHALGLSFLRADAAQALDLAVPFSSPGVHSLPGTIL